LLTIFKNHAFMKNIYADTSVIGGCFDNEFKGHSLSLFDAFKTMVC